MPNIWGIKRLLATALIFTLYFATPAAGAPFRVCTITLGGPEESATIRSHLAAEDFDFTNFNPPPLIASDDNSPALVPSDESHRDKGASWLESQCRPELRCDVVVISGEFAGAFFGSSGTLRIQDLEKASCRPECDGVFHSAREVFLLACNTLATKAQDERTPTDYLHVLLSHGFDGASAQRAVDLRYGPLGPSFRESFRRIFMGVPRIYGFSSVAPRAEWSTPRLAEYFRMKGDYRRYLEQTGRATTENLDLLRAFKGLNATQVSGFTPGEPGAAGRMVMCRLYDENLSVTQRLWTIRQVMSGSDLLSYLPRIAAFLHEHPPRQYTGSEKYIFNEIRHQQSARDQVLGLLNSLEFSAEKMEMAHLSLQLGWIDREQFRRIAVASTRQLLGESLQSGSVDIICEIAKHEPLGTFFSANDLPPQPVFADAEWYRMVACIAPMDPRVGERIMRGLNSPDLSARLWTSYALSRIPLDTSSLVRLAGYLTDESPDVRTRLEWIFKTKKPLPKEVRDALMARDPVFAATL